MATARSPDGVSHNAGISTAPESTSSISLLQLRPLAFVPFETVSALAGFPAKRQVFTDMAVAAAEPITEGSKQTPRKRRNRRVVVFFLFAQQRIEVGAGLPVTDLHQALEMIQARAPHLHPFGRQAKDGGDLVSRHENSVAQSNGANLAVLPQGQNDTAFRVGKVDEQRPRTTQLHLAYKFENDGQCAQGKEQPAWAAVLSQCVTNAEFARHLKVELPEPVPINGGRIDDKLRAVEGQPANRWCTRSSIPRPIFR